MARNSKRAKAERPAESPAAKRVLAEESLRKAQEVSAHARRTAAGPVGVTALLIGLLALAGVLVAWLFLAA